jgi:hypothetical protein
MFARELHSLGKKLMYFISVIFGRTVKKIGKALTKMLVGMHWKREGIRLVFLTVLVACCMRACKISSLGEMMSRKITIF